MASTTTVTRSTLDIVFHIDDNTTMGSSYTWKLNFPDTNPNLTLNQVKNAFDFDGATTNTWGDLINNYGIRPYTKDGYEIDGVDGARIVTTITSKRELS